LQESEWTGKRTETRVNVFCTPEGCALEKLMQAYVSMGGNPLDISPFWLPDKQEIKQDQDEDEEAEWQHAYPHGGVAAPISTSSESTVSASDPDGDDDTTGSTNYGEHMGGWLNIQKYPPRRLGGRAEASFDKDHTAIAATVGRARLFANQEIKYKLHDLEHRIIKLMDLREQLENEIDEVLMSAFGGSMEAENFDEIEGWDTELYHPDMRVQAIIRDIDSIIFHYKDSGDGTIVFFEDSDEIALRSWVYEDHVSEGLLDLMW